MIKIANDLVINESNILNTSFNGNFYQKEETHNTFIPSTIISSLQSTTNLQQTNNININNTYDSNNSNNNVNLCTINNNANNSKIRNNLTANSNIFTFDVWTECLGIFFSYDFIFSKCPQTRLDAWPFIYTRLQQLFPLVDPNESPEMSRTSMLFGGGANSLEKIRNLFKFVEKLSDWCLLSHIRLRQIYILRYL